MKSSPMMLCLWENIDPSYPLVYGTPEEVTAKAIEIIDGTRGRGVFLSSGCAMGRNTRPDNVRAMVAAAKRYGSRERLLEM